MREEVMQSRPETEQDRVFREKIERGEWEIIPQVYHGDAPFGFATGGVVEPFTLEKLQLAWESPDADPVQDIRDVSDAHFEAWGTADPSTIMEDMLRAYKEILNRPW